MARGDTAAAWNELYAVLPDGWTVMPPQWRPLERVWAVYARTGRSGSARGHWREGLGQSEAIALRALAQQFRLGAA